MESGSLKKESLTVGYFWSFGATALPLISAFIVSLIIARLMGPRVVGLINMTMALATVFLIVGKFGVGGAASRLISEYQVSAVGLIPRLVRASVLLRLIFTLPVSVAATVMAPRLAAFFGDMALLPLFRLSGLLIGAVSFNELAGLMILGLKRFRLLFTMRIWMFALRISLVLMVVMFTLGTAYIIGAFTASAFVPGLIVLVLLFGIEPGSGSQPGNAHVFKRLFLLSAPLAVSGASVTVYALLDKLMLGYFEDASQVGLYSMARNIVETSLFPTFALIMTLRPALASAYTSGDKERCSTLLNRSLKNSLVYATAVVVVLSCLARPLIIGLFTDRFITSADLLVLFLPLIVMRSLGAIILPGLIAAERADTYARLTFAGAVCNFILNMLLIPVWKAKGAVAATLISYLPIEIVGLRAITLAFPRFWHREDVWRVLKIAAAGVAIFFLYGTLFPEPGDLIRTIVQAILIVVAFSALLVALRAVTPGEIKDLLRPLTTWRRK